MNWSLNYSKDAYQFIVKNHIEDLVIDLVKKFLQGRNNPENQVDVKKLFGKWEGYYRIRKGSIRIIFSLSYSEKIIFINKIDNRGDAYKDKN